MLLGANQDTKWLMHSCVDLWITRYLPSSLPSTFVPVVSHSRQSSLAFYHSPAVVHLDEIISIGHIETKLTCLQEGIH